MRRWHVARAVGRGSALVSVCALGSINDAASLTRLCVAFGICLAVGAAGYMLAETATARIGDAG